MKKLIHRYKEETHFRDLKRKFYTHKKIENKAKKEEEEEIGKDNVNRK